MQPRQVCSTPANFLTHFIIIIDSGASISLVNDITLLRDLLQVLQVHISGIGGQALSSNIEGQWGLFGPALFVEGLSRKSFPSESYPHSTPYFSRVDLLLHPPKQFRGAIASS